MKNTVTKNGSHYYRFRRAGKEVYLRLPSPEAWDFEAAYRKAEQLHRLQGPLPTTRVRQHNARIRKREKGGQIIPGWATDLVREARKRAVRKSLRFSISKPELQELVDRAGGCCEVTGTPFQFQRWEGSLYRPFAPSLDRIDHREGYVMGNIRLVCVMVNAALNQWGEGPFWHMLQHAASKAGGNCPEVSPTFFPHVLISRR